MLNCRTDTRLDADCHAWPLSEMKGADDVGNIGLEVKVNQTLFKRGIHHPAINILFLARWWLIRTTRGL